MSTEKQYQEGQGPSSPWGRVQFSKTYGRGVTMVSTAGHGGFRVSQGLVEKKFLPEVQAAAIKRSGYYFFEEDCDYALVMLSLPWMFVPAELEAARASGKDWNPELFKLITGEDVSLEESCVLRRRAFETETHNRFVGVSASGSWKEGVPEGMVEVIGRRVSDGAEKTILVSADTYKARGKLGYVFPEAA